MSSILLKPTMRVPFTCSAPKRLDVSTIGSPSVFHTAPPQPASNARMICSPVLVGGALASQNGLGLLMPANEIDRSAMGLIPTGAGAGPRGSWAHGPGVALRREHSLGGVAALRAGRRAGSAAPGRG